MIIEIFAASVAITGFITAAYVKAASLDAKQSEQNAIARKEQAEKKARRLLGVKIGVACFEPNGSVHDLEGEVINCILQTSGRCVTTNRHLIREHLKGLDVCKHDESLVNADLLIAGTVIEQSTTLEKIQTVPSWTSDFLVWVKSNYPKNMYGGDDIESSFSGDVTREYLVRTYQNDTNKMAAECGKVTVTEISLRVDFRCYSPQGEVMGAGVIAKELKKTDSESRLSEIRALAKEIVDRIHVSTSDGSVEVWYGDARAMATTRRIQEDQWKLIEGRKNGDG